jgi:group I intron endonuclease
MKYYIYKIFNLKNNKMYIGKAKRVDRRWSEHLRNVKNGKQHPLYDAIRKHGLESFQFSVVLETTSSEVDILEKELIQELSRYPIGYNLAEGGTGGDAYRYHDETAQKTRSDIGRKSYAENPRGISTKSQKGVHITDVLPDIKQKWKENHAKSMEKLSARRKSGSYTENELLGYQKQSAAKLGGNNPRAQSIKCLELEKIFGSIGEVVRELGYNSPTPILYSCKTGKQTKKGHLFQRVANTPEKG